MLAAAASEIARVTGARLGVLAADANAVGAAVVGGGPHPDRVGAGRERGRERPGPERVGAEIPAQRPSADVAPTGVPSAVDTSAAMQLASDFARISPLTDPRFAVTAGKRIADLGSGNLVLVVEDSRAIRALVASHIAQIEGIDLADAEKLRVH